jgi:hypothetical protein
MSGSPNLHRRHAASFVRLQVRRFDLLARCSSIAVAAIAFPLFPIVRR